jgi:serine/threonine protein kinase
VRQPVPFGKYLLLDRISVGGMAEVFKAKSYGVEGFEKIIAIKRILPTMGEDRDFIKMFIDEAKIAGQLAHTNICQIFELGRIDGSHFIAMEYIWGKDLLQIQNRLRKLKSQMPIAMACFVIAKVLEGLDYAHRKRDPLGRPLEIVHRDCSPQNVLVSYEGEVKVIDFGIAKATSRNSRTMAGVLKGKFGYMSPEQVRGLPLDRRSDIFAIGTMFYECLTGERLFQGETDFSTLEKVRNVDIQTPRSVNPAIPEAVEQVILKALAKDVEDRYQWCSEMLADIQHYLISQEVVFTAKSLSGNLKDTFSADLERERAQLETYKRVGRDGLIAGVPAAEAKLDVVEQLGEAGLPEGDATTLGGPNFDDVEQAAGARLDAGPSGNGAASARSGAALGTRPPDLTDDEFGEEAPTEHYADSGGELLPAVQGVASPAAPRVPTPSGRYPAQPGYPQPIAAAAASPSLPPSGRTSVPMMHVHGAGAPAAQQPMPMVPDPQAYGQGYALAPGYGGMVPGAPQLGPAMTGDPAFPNLAGQVTSNTMLGVNAPQIPQYAPPYRPSQPMPVVQPHGQHRPSQPPPVGQPYGQQRPSQPLPAVQPYGQQRPSQPLPAVQPYGQQRPSQPLPAMQPPYGHRPSQPPPMGQPYGQQRPSQPLPAMQPYGHPGYLPSPGMPPNYSPQGLSSMAPGYQPAMPPAGKRHSTLGRDIAIGVGIGALVLAAFLLIKLFVIDRDDESPPASSLATMQLSMLPGVTAELYIDGKNVESVADKAEIPVEPGVRNIKLVGPTGMHCEEPIKLEAGKTTVVECPLGPAPGEQSQTGSGTGSAGSGSTGSGTAGGSASNVPTGTAPAGTAPTGSAATGSGSGSATAGSAGAASLGSTQASMTATVRQRGESASNDNTKTPPGTPRSTATDTTPTPAPSTGTSDAKGYLQLDSKPAARIAVDGADTGKHTPTKLTLPPGKHKITFSIGDDRFSYPIVIRPGETQAMTKDLQ